MKRRLFRLQEQVQRAEEQEQREVKEREDAKRGHPNFKVGDEVLCRQLPGSIGGKMKQEFKYHGPYIITEVLANGAAAKLAGLSQGMPTIINVEYLRKYKRNAAVAKGVAKSPSSTCSHWFHRPIGMGGGRSHGISEYQRQERISSKVEGLPITNMAATKGSFWMSRFNKIILGKDSTLAPIVEPPPKGRRLEGESVGARVTRK